MWSDEDLALVKGSELEMLERTYHLALPWLYLGRLGCFKL